MQFRSQCVSSAGVNASYRFRVAGKYPPSGFAKRVAGAAAFAKGLSK
jgi:hypothetical protein